MQTNLTLKEIKDGIAAGEFTLPELVKAYLSEIKSSNDRVNAVVFYDEDDALKQAEAIQAKIDAGTAGKLAGVVVGVKDLICQQDVQATCCSNILKGFESTYDATVIEKLRKEDALFLGRLNMDEFAMGSSTENSIYGPCHNPIDTDRVPGGSSGGSAAAVAANYCTISLGSDTGGSIRQPASYCGVVGLKPSYGRVSRYGLIAYASSFDCIGPLARSVEDAATLLEIISGADGHDMTSADLAVENYAEAVQNPKKDLKIGVPEEYFGEGLDPEIKETIEAQLKELEADGATLVPISLPNIKYAISTYYILATAEASSNLARFDGIRYGHRADMDVAKEDLAKEKAALSEAIRKAESADEKASLEEQLSKVDSNLNRLYKQSRTEGFGTEVKRRIMLGTYVLSAGYYDAYYGKAQRIRRLIKEDFEKAYEKVDVIVSPTAPTTAFKIGENANDPIQMYLNDIYTISANLSGNCALSVPCGTHSNGMPIGIQFSANAYNESVLLQAGRLVELKQAK